MTDTNHIAEARKKVSRPKIREVFLHNGAVIPIDRDDLPDYVYEAAFELLELAAPAVQNEAFEALASQLLAKRAEILGRPLKWAEAIEIMAIVTSMPDEEKQRLLDMDDAPAVQGEPVALPPFATKIIEKLRRFDECAEDGQDVDIGRHWLDMLVQLGLLNRVQRSPALWEMAQQGEDVLEGYTAPQPAEQQPEPDVAGLVEALESLIKGYVRLLEAGMDRITSLGGDCDPVPVMEQNDPWLRDARAALAAHQEKIE